MATQVEVNAADIKPAPDAPPSQTQSAPKGESFVMPEKFKGKSAEEIARSYVELERHKAEAPKEQPKEQPKEAPKDLPKDLKAVPTPAEEAQKKVENAGLKWEDFSKEWMEKGQLSKESYAKLESKGIPKEMVDSYVEAQKAAAQLEVHEAARLVGGDERLQSMLKWVGTLDNTEIEAYNRAITSANKADRMSALKSWNARFAMESGDGPQRTLGGNNDPFSMGSGSYASTQEYIADVRNPLYAQDEAFRVRVINKLAKSNI